MVNQRNEPVDLVCGVFVTAVGLATFIELTSQPSSTDSWITGGGHPLLFVLIGMLGFLFHVYYERLQEDTIFWIQRRAIFILPIGAILLSAFGGPRLLVAACIGMAMSLFISLLIRWLIFITRR